MKKIFMTAITGTALAFTLNSCNSDEANQKLMAADDAAVQSLVDQHSTAMQAEVTAKCAATVDSLANAKFTAWQEETAKAGKKGGTPKKATPKTPTKPTDPKIDVGQKNANDKKIDVGQKGTENPHKINLGQKK